MVEVGAMGGVMMMMEMLPCLFQLELLEVRRLQEEEERRRKPPSPEPVEVQQEEAQR